MQELDPASIPAPAINTGNATPQVGTHKNSDSLVTIDIDRTKKPRIDLNLTSVIDAIHITNHDAKDSPEFHARDPVFPHILSEDTSKNTSNTRIAQDDLPCVISDFASNVKELEFKTEEKLSAVHRLDLGQDHNKVLPSKSDKNESPNCIDSLKPPVENTSNIETSLHSKAQFLQTAVKGSIPATTISPFFKSSELGSHKKVKLAELNRKSTPKYLQPELRNSTKEDFEHTDHFLPNKIKKPQRRTHRHTQTQRKSTSPAGSNHTKDTKSTLIQNHREISEKPRRKVCELDKSSSDDFLIRENKSSVSWVNSDLPMGFNNIPTPTSWLENIGNNAIIDKKHVLETNLGFQNKSNTAFSSNSKELLDPETSTDQNASESHESKSQEYPSCPICYETFSTSASRRAISLTCGHVFCKKCIYKWFGIKQNINKTIYSSKIKISRRPCPKCNKLSSHKDFRVIFPTCLIAADENKIDNMVEKLNQEQMVTINQKAEIARINDELKISNMEKEYLRKALEDLSYRLTMAESEIKNLKLEIENSKSHHDQSTVSLITYINPIEGANRAKSTTDSPDQGLHQLSNIDASAHENCFSSERLNSVSQIGNSDKISSNSQENSSPRISSDELEKKPHTDDSKDSYCSEITIPSSFEPESNDTSTVFSTRRFDLKGLFDGAAAVMSKHDFRDIYFICTSKSESYECRLLCMVPRNSPANKNSFSERNLDILSQVDLHQHKRPIKAIAKSILFCENLENSAIENLLICTCSIDTLIVTKVCVVATQSNENFSFKIELKIVYIHQLKTTVWHIEPDPYIQTRFYLGLGACQIQTLDVNLKPEMNQTSIESPVVSGNNFGLVSLLDSSSKISHTLGYTPIHSLAVASLLGSGPVIKNKCKSSDRFCSKYLIGANSDWVFSISLSQYCTSCYNESKQSPDNVYPCSHSSGNLPGSSNFQAIDTEDLANFSRVQTNNDISKRVSPLIKASESSRICAFAYDSVSRRVLISCKRKLPGNALRAKKANYNTVAQQMTICRKHMLKKTFSDFGSERANGINTRSVLSTNCGCSGKHNECVGIDPSDRYHIARSSATNTSFRIYNLAIVDQKISATICMSHNLANESGIPSQQPAIFGLDKVLLLSVSQNQTPNQSRSSECRSLRETQVANSKFPSNSKQGQLGIENLMVHGQQTANTELFVSTDITGFGQIQDWQISSSEFAPSSKSFGGVQSNLEPASAPNSVLAPAQIPASSQPLNLIQSTLIVAFDRLTNTVNFYFTDKSMQLVQIQKFDLGAGKFFSLQHSSSQSTQKDHCVRNGVARLKFQNAQMQSFGENMDQGQDHDHDHGQNQNIDMNINMDDSLTGHTDGSLAACLSESQENNPLSPKYRSEFTIPSNSVVSVLTDSSLFNTKLDA